MDAILISIISGLIGMLCMFLNSKVCNKKNLKQDYVKIFILIFIIVYGVQYYVSNKSVSLVGGSKDLEVDIDDPNFWIKTNKKIFFNSIWVLLIN